MIFFWPRRTADGGKSKRQSYNFRPQSKTKKVGIRIDGNSLRANETNAKWSGGQLDITEHNTITQIAQN